jgi:hypothetical protein
MNRDDILRDPLKNNAFQVARELLYGCEKDEQTLFIVAEMILKFHGQIEQIKRDIFITDEANKGLGRIVADLKNDKEQLKELIKELREPKGCNACNYLADNVCNHPGIPEFYTPQYINYSGCGLLESKA